ncbi:hypothetical protein chiPu_0032597, partial [Chiloscyllium punctatum]|nr:hypothetical protein [Chiloscyllium punctatum]
MRGWSREVAPLSDIGAIQVIVYTATRPTPASGTGRGRDQLQSVKVRPRGVGTVLRETEGRETGELGTVLRVWGLT